MSFKFLTKKKFDYSRLKKVLAENPDGLETKENQDIYRQLLQEIQSGDFSLIGPQASYFLSSHQESIWTSYLIHRW